MPSDNFNPNPFFLIIKPGNFYKFQNTKLQVQATTSENVGFMIGGHGMDDSCEVSRCLMGDLWWEDTIPIHSGVAVTCPGPIWLPVFGQQQQSSEAGCS